ncbi:uncharacterized protein LOC136062817 [Quercus suber]|uniref:uncharacterized protein LOC136062817 n=1 Tax=Quercus suber TaxID=58331 RepID=UPI0032DE43DB
MGDLGPDFYSSDLYVWLKEKCKLTKPSSQLQISWNTLFSFGVWTLWNHRNRVVFKNTPLRPSTHKEVIQRAAEFAFCAKNQSVKSPRVERFIQWERLVRVSRGKYLLVEYRVEQEKWDRRFGLFSTTSFLAELWALKDGLQMCLHMHINALEVELDTKVISDLMNNIGSPNTTNYAIVANCRALISQIPQVKVKYCFRERNRCADGLARLGCSL